MIPFDPTLDLEISRLMSASAANIWRCWMEPTLLAQWFAPKPVITKDVVIDARPGGEFSTMMILPDGAEHPTQGCFLLVEPERRLIFTDALEKGFRPATGEMFGFTAIITLAPEGTQTRYTARALHRAPDAQKKHADMGFHDGWGAAATQLEALAGGL